MNKNGMYFDRMFFGVFVRFDVIALDKDNE